MTERPEDGGGSSVWQRLRRRKVVQWGVAYAAAAWGFLQGLEYVSNVFDWPRQIQRFATIGLLVGLAIAVVLAWYHGDRGERRVTRTELVILTLLFLIGGGLFWRYQHMGAAPELPSVAHSAATSTITAVTTTDRSIAVLPFVNMSPDKEQEYFADGISEELLNLLAQVPELRVIARTSSFSFKGKEVDIAEIAKKLNVAHVLEGSVRRSEDRIRITAQLIRTPDSSHLWSQSYDRELTDVFAVQDEIASAPTSAEGHAALSHILWHERRWRLAEEEARRAVALNPSSAMGYEWLGMALTALGRLEEANAAFRQALALDPLSQTYYANAASVLVNLGRYGDAESMMQRAVQLGELGFTPFLWWTGLDVLLRVGRIDEAERWVERCAALGPRAELLVQILRARVLYAQGHQRAARDLLAGVGSRIPPGAGFEVFVSGASFMIGEVDSGFYWLQHTSACADLLAMARFLPEIQQVIAHPRMQALLKDTRLEGLPATGPGTPPAR